MQSFRLTLALSLLICVATANAGDSPPSTGVLLPAPKLDGPVSVEKALHQRRSLRNPAPTPLTLEEISQLCWSAQGVTDDKGHRTAPSARARYPLELYVIAGTVSDLASGVYQYDPTLHALALLRSGDIRASFVEGAIGQDWIVTAPAILVITGKAERLSGMDERGRQFIYVEAGLAAQGFFLQATAMGLGSTYVGGFSPIDARTFLGLQESEEVLAVLPVGRKP